MLIETDRLYLRSVRTSDADALYRLHVDPLVVTLISNGTEMSRTESDERLALYLREWQEYHFGFFIVYEKQATGDLTFAGRTGLRDLDGEVELGYCFSSQASGRGLATEAARPMIDLAFSTHRVDKIVALVRPTNSQSSRVLRKLGFAYVTTTLHRNVQYDRFELHSPNKIAQLN